MQLDFLLYFRRHLRGKYYFLKHDFPPTTQIDLMLLELCSVVVEPDDDSDIHVDAEILVDHICPVTEKEVRRSIVPDLGGARDLPGRHSPRGVARHAPHFRMGQVDDAGVSH